MGMTVNKQSFTTEYCDAAAAVLELKLNKETTAFQNS